MPVPRPGRRCGTVSHLSLRRQDTAALQLHKAFVADMKAAEATIDQRNSGESVARSVETGGLPYNYLIPSSTDQPDTLPNITGRGIPYSISI